MPKLLQITQRQHFIRSHFLLLLLTGLTNVTFAHSGRDQLRGNEISLLNANTALLYPITGKVLDDTGSPLPGATIVLKGSSSVGTTTDGEGRFTLNIPENTVPVLIISSIGYATQEVAVNNRTTLEIRLLVDAKSLGEVVVIGYGTQKKADLTGSVAVIDIKELNQQP